MVLRPLKVLLLIVTLLLISGALRADAVMPGSQLWASSYSGPSDSQDSAAAVVTDAAGNVYVAGQDRPPAGGRRAVLIKYDQNGAMVWTRRFRPRAQGFYGASAVSLDKQGNIFVAGTGERRNYNYDFLVIKYNPAGVRQWVRYYNGTGNSYDSAVDMAVDSQGNALVLGSSGGLPADASYIQYDFAVVKYSPTGQRRWVKRYDSQAHGYDLPSAVAIDAEDNVYVTGGSGTSLNTPFHQIITIKYGRTGRLKWLHKYTKNYHYWNIDYPTSKNSLSDGMGNDIAVDQAGSVLVTGYVSGWEDRDDYMTIKYAADGKKLWVRRFNGAANGSDQAVALGLDKSGNVYVAGISDSTQTRRASDYLTIKYSASGKRQWTARYDGPGRESTYWGIQDRVAAMAVDNDGNAVVTGTTYGGIVSGYDYTTVKYDGAGALRWTRSYDGPGQDSLEDQEDYITDAAGALAIDTSGTVYVTGTAYMGIDACRNIVTVKYAP